jgi:hypothetical protein
MRHHRGAEDADGDVERLRVRHDRGRRKEKAAGDPGHLRPAREDLEAEARRDHRDQADDERVDVAEAAGLQVQHEQDVERGQAHAPDQGDPEQQLQGQGRADDSARSQAAMASLHEHRHQVRQQDDGERLVSVRGAGGEVGGPVAGVHVANGHQKAGAGEGRGLANDPGGLGHSQCPIHLRQRRNARLVAPGCERGHGLAMGSALVVPHHPWNFRQEPDTPASPCPGGRPFRVLAEQRANASWLRRRASKATRWTNDSRAVHSGGRKRERGHRRDRDEAARGQLRGEDTVLGPQDLWIALALGQAMTEFKKGLATGVREEPGSPKEPEPTGLGTMSADNRTNVD